MHSREICSQCSINDGYHSLSPHPNYQGKQSQVFPVHSPRPWCWPLEDEVKATKPTVLKNKNKTRPHATALGSALKRDLSPLVTHLYMSPSCVWTAGKLQPQGPGEDSFPTMPWGLKTSFKDEKKVLNQHNAPKHHRNRDYYLPSYQIWAASKSPLAKLRENEERNGSCW